MIKIKNMEIIKSNRRSEKNSAAKKFFFSNYDPEKEINKLATAEALNVSRQTIYNWIKEIKKAKSL